MSKHLDMAVAEERLGFEMHQNITKRRVSPIAVILVILCLASTWYYALSISSMGGVGLRPGHVNDFYQMWSASRAILRHANPYGPEVTRQNQIAAYGTTAEALGMQIDRRLIYPLPGTFPFLLLGWLSFRVADFVILGLMITLVALSIGWLRGSWDRTTVVYTALAFGTYPVVVGLQMRQPTLVYLGLIIWSFALVRSGHLVWAGWTAALASGKPQIAIPVLIPILVWATARWNDRKRFAIAFFVSMLGLFILSFMLSPDWLSEWLTSMHGYSQYVHASIIVAFFGRRIGLFVSFVLLLGLIAALWLSRDRDLFFQVALSVALFELIIQGELYNMALLIIPAIWVADHTDAIRQCEPTGQIALAIVKVALVELWAAAAIGSLLMHTQSGRPVGWWLSTNMVFPVLVSLAAIMVLQLFCNEQLLDCEIHS